ncbi:hypothetical protein PpBr36_00707 [Pyricularia pennisetigena]|uniref:hypothetical protein n=1 Tax=Pyricularia pennisetigena TaxID=1578925 RepID=UPI0011504F53|nr:hypothetical protein PpBr36_00707 [Pyricularia pennisetigena]TLS28011.1 hypothetical protein PpBr36_00707 [Pyricularia pennisetigena]
MPSSRRPSSAAAADRAERMVSHNRYTSEQKRFFAVNLKLWNQKLISKDEVIKRFREKFNDQKFGYSQYRYLRQEVGRDVEFGAPLLQIQEQNALMTVPQTATYTQSFSYQQPQTVSVPQDSYEDTFPAPVADSSPFLQQDFLSGYGDFADLKLLLGDDAEAAPATVIPTPQSPFPLMPAQQQQQQQYQQQPDATDAFECTGGGSCTIPLGAPHKHELNGSIVFPNEKVVVSMIAMEKILMETDNMDQEVDGTKSETLVSSCASGPAYAFTASTSQQDTFTATPATQNIKTNGNSISAGFEYESPLLQNLSPDLGTITGAVDLDSSLTDMVFDDDMLNQLCNGTGQGMAGGTDAMYLPTSMATQYPFLQLPARNPWMSTAGPPDSGFNYTTTTPTGLPNWSQAGSHHFAPSTQPGGNTASPSRWTPQQLSRMTPQQPAAAMAIPRRGIGASYAPAATRQQQTREAGFGLDLGVGGMQTAYSPSTTGIVPPSLWPGNASPAVVNADLGAATRVPNTSRCFDTNSAAGGSDTPQ